MQLIFTKKMFTYLFRLINVMVVMINVIIIDINIYNQFAFVNKFVNRDSHQKYNSSIVFDNYSVYKYACVLSSFSFICSNLYLVR